MENSCYCVIKSNANGKGDRLLDTRKAPKMFNRTQRRVTALWQTSPGNSATVAHAAASDGRVIDVEEPTIQRLDAGTTGVRTSARKRDGGLFPRHWAAGFNPEPPPRIVPKRMVAL